MGKVQVGTILHYFPKVGVAVVSLSGELKVGDRISVEGGATAAFEQVVDSMQIEHKNIEGAKAGDDIGLKVVERVHEKDAVYKVTEE